MSLASHSTHRGNSHVTVLRHYSTHAHGRKIHDGALIDQHLGTTRKMDSQHAHMMAHRGYFGIARTTPKRFQLDLALPTLRSCDSRLPHRRYATKDQTLRWLVNGIQRRPRLHRPDRPCRPIIVVPLQLAHPAGWTTYDEQPAQWRQHSKRSLPLLCK
jgi:hypothetical protein